MTDTSNLTPVKTQAYLFINGAYQSGTMMIYKSGKWERITVNVCTKLNSYST